MALKGRENEERKGEKWERRVAVKATVMLTLESFMSATHGIIVVRGFIKDSFQFPFKHKGKTLRVGYVQHTHTNGRAITAEFSSHARICVRAREKEENPFG